MFFEGSEKKVEIIVSPSVGSLLQKGDGYWEALVEKCGAKILSKIENDHCIAYLLSESSLFVFENRLTMITCGQTTLVNSVADFVSKYGAENIESVIYERKNEYFPQHQRSDFYEDLDVLKQYIPGKAFRFGNADEHHLYLFHMKEAFEPGETDTTLEILMYDLQGPVKNLFRQVNQSAENIRKLTGVDNIIPGFKVDDYVFEPFGYSLNAIKDDKYFTIHVTPQELGNYVSFETNMSCQEGYSSIVQNVLEVFQPTSFDVVNFQPNNCEKIKVNNYKVRSMVEEELECGYGVSYTHYFETPKDPQNAKIILE